MTGKGAGVTEEERDAFRSVNPQCDQFSRQLGYPLWQKMLSFVA